MKNSETKKVVLDHITKEYISPDKKVFKAVDDISLEIEAGSFVTLLGPSGCGKTTTLRMIAGFEESTKGDIFIGDQKVNKISPDKRDTAMVFQSYALFPHYDVYNNISFGLKLKKVPEKEISEKVREIMGLVGLSGLEERFPNQLSGGQQQRVALARSLVVEPSVLLFDEPLSNLDAKLRVSMRTEIKKIQRRFGITSIYVTHDQSEAMALSDQIIVMNQGKIEQIGTPHEIYFHPKSRFVADFIGRSNFIEGKVIDVLPDGVMVSCMGSSIFVPSDRTFLKGSDATMMVRPEAASLCDEGEIKVKVLSSVFMGSYQEYQIQIEDKSLILEDYDFLSRKIYKEGEEAYLNFKKGGVHLIG